MAKAERRSSFYPAGDQSVIIRKLEDGKESVRVVTRDARKDVVILCENQEESLQIAMKMARARKAAGSWDFLYKNEIRLVTPLLGDEEGPSRGGVFGKTQCEAGGA